MMLYRGLTIPLSLTSTPCPEALPSLLTSSKPSMVGKLGVVVLSDDFLTSKWPMVELERLVRKRDKGSQADVLPLFYKLQPADLKSDKNLSEWRLVWKELGGKYADKWEQAVKSLRSFNGEILVPGTSEAAYVKRVVRHICNLVPSPILYDLAHIQGRQRMAQVIHLMRENLGPYDLFLAIDNVWESSLEIAKRLLTVSFSANSRILLTSRSEEVLKDLLRGHSNAIVVPLPSPDQQEAFHIFQESFELGDLNTLLENRNLLDSVLKKCFFSGNYHALALKALGRYVRRGVGFCEAGLDKVRHILQEIQNITALQKVEDLVRLNFVNLTDEKKHMFLDIVVVVMSVEGGGFLTHNIAVTHQEAYKWLSFLYTKYSKSTSTIDNLLAFDGLIQLDDKSSGKRILVHDLYFDLAHSEAATSARFFIDRSATHVEEVEWKKLERVILSERHDGRQHFIETLLQQKCGKLQVLCAFDIDFKNGIHLGRMPSLCVLMLTGGKLGRIKDWSASKGLAIVYLHHLDCAPPLPAIPSLPCLEELFIRKVETVKGCASLQGLQHLKKLVLDDAFDVFRASYFSYCKASYFNSLTNLESLQITHFTSKTRDLNLNALVKLQNLDIGWCESLTRIDGLHALKNLQTLIVTACPSLSNLDGLSGLLQIADVRIMRCEALQRLPDLSGLTCLGRLRLWDNESLEEVGGLMSPALKHVDVGSCWALKTMPDLSGLTCLESLTLSNNISMEEVGGENMSSSLHCLSIRDCRRLKRFPSLNECVRLQELEADALFIEKHENSLPNLQKLSLRIGGERTIVERLISGRLIESVQELNVEGGEWSSIERLVGGLAHLRHLTISGCDSVVKLDVGCLPSNLGNLEVKFCDALEEVGDLSALHSLVKLYFYRCKSLKKLDGLCNIIPHLRSLTLKDCDSLDESTLPSVTIGSILPNF